MTITEINSKEEFLNCVMEASDNIKYIVVEFYVPNCITCNIIAPQFNKLSNSLNSVIFLKINCGKLPEFINLYQIGLFPTTIIFEKGKTDPAFRPIVGPFVGKIEYLLKMALQGIKLKDDF